MKETQVEISKKKQESKEKSKTKIKNDRYFNNKHGITLIALVVTIVVMLILAGITIQTAIGEGGIINLANEAKEQQIIASYKDRIGIVGINWSLNRVLDDTVTVDDLWQDMQDAKIINNKETDVEKVDEKGNYIITVPEGYKFQIHINEYDDVEIDYIGKEDDLLPYINEITVISQTTNSVELQVSVSRLNGGTLNYYYKEKGEPDENYQLIKGDTTELTASISGLTDKTTYEIKVEASNENGTTEKEIEVLIGELKGTIRQRGETVWNNGIATIYLETDVPNAEILYQVNTIGEVYKTYNEEEGITGLKYGDTVFAVLSDGTNITDYTSINIRDTIVPQQAQISLSDTTAKEGESITATVTHADKESGVAITNCKWVYNITGTSIGTEEGSYTGGNFSSNGQTINLTATTAGTYYLHVLTVDKAGNKIESISNAVTVEKGSIPIENITTIQKDNTRAEDKYGNIVTVPKGFKVVTSEGTTVPEGIVIEDANGNQFVWIPVGIVYKNTEKTESSTIILGRYTFDEINGTPTLQQAAFEEDNLTDFNQTYVDEVPIMGYNDNHIELTESRPGTVDDSDHLNDLNATAKNLEKFVQSVEEKGGYYLARYEASYGSGYNSTGSTDEEKYESAKPLSKVSIANSTSSMTYDTPGKLWNFITQINASKVSQNMYANDSSVGVESDLTNSYAWDTAIVFIQEMKNSNYANANCDTTGNDILKNTGKTGDKVCNIFDMAANIIEWTTEYSAYTNSIDGVSFPCTFRGSGYNISYGYTSIREISDTTTSMNGIGFRVTLYVK